MKHSSSGAFFPAAKVMQAAKDNYAYCIQKRREKDEKKVVAAFHRYLGATLLERITGRSSKTKTYYRVRAYENTDKVVAWQWFNDYVKPNNLHNLWDGEYSELGWVEGDSTQMSRLEILAAAAGEADKHGNQIFLSVEDLDLFPIGIPS